MTRAGTPLADETREVILDLRARGMSDEAIGERVGRTGGSVRHIIATARAKGDPRAAYLSDEDRRRRIVVSRNAALGHSVPDALRGGGSVHPPATSAALSSSGPRSVRAETPASSAGGVPPENCAGFEQSDPAAFWEEIVAAFMAGATIASLSARYDRHPHTIRRKLSRRGLVDGVDDAKPAQKLDPKMRPCLGWCGKKFLSSWAGERKCARCRNAEGAGAWW